MVNKAQPVSKITHRVSCVNLKPKKMDCVSLEREKRPQAEWCEYENVPKNFYKYIFVLNIFKWNCFCLFTMFGK